MRSGNWAKTKLKMLGQNIQSGSFVVLLVHNFNIQKYHGIDFLVLTKYGQDYI